MARPRRKIKTSTTAAATAIPAMYPAVRGPFIRTLKVLLAVLLRLVNEHVNSSPKKLDVGRNERVVEL